MSHIHFNLAEFSKGDLLTWSIFSQWAEKLTVTLSEGGEIFFTKTKDAGTAEPKFVTESSDTHTVGKAPQLMVEMRAGRPLWQFTCANAILKELPLYQGYRKTGYIYDIFIDGGNGNNFKDVHIHIAGWTCSNRSITRMEG